MKKATKKKLEPIKQPIGYIHPSRTMFLRVHGADAKNGKREYECSAEARSMMPIVLSKQTGKSFTIPWQQIIEMGIDAGIDKPDARESYAAK